MAAVHGRSACQHQQAAGLFGKDAGLSPLTQAHALRRAVCLTRSRSAVAASRQEATASGSWPTMERSVSSALALPASNMRLASYSSAPGEPRGVGAAGCRPRKAQLLQRAVPLRAQAQRQLPDRDTTHRQGVCAATACWQLPARPARWIRSRRRPPWRREHAAAARGARWTPDARRRPLRRGVCRPQCQS